MNCYIPRNPRGLLWNRVSTRHEGSASPGAVGTHDWVGGHVVAVKTLAIKVVDLVASDLDPIWGERAQYYLKVECSGGRVGIAGATRSSAMHDAFLQCLCHIKAEMAEINEINVDRVVHEDELCTRSFEGPLKDVLRSVTSNLTCLFPADSILGLDVGPDEVLVLKGFVRSKTDLDRVRSFVGGMAGTTHVRSVDSSGVVCASYEGINLYT